MKKLTKENIEELGNKVVEICKEHGYTDTSVYFNGKRIKIVPDGWDEEHDVEKSVIIVEQDINPVDYFGCNRENHILSMSFEGLLYDLYNDWNYECPVLDKLFESYGLYHESWNAWNLSLYPIHSDMEVEGINYGKEEVPIHIWRYAEGNPEQLQKIMDWWWLASRDTGDKGSCVIGAGMNFEWQGNKYFMSSCSPYQGSLSWEEHVETVKSMLELIGATNIVYDWGRLD